MTIKYVYVVIEMCFVKSVILSLLNVQLNFTEFVLLVKIEKPKTVVSFFFTCDTTFCDAQFCFAKGKSCKHGTVSRGSWLTECHCRRASCALRTDTKCASDHKTGFWLTNVLYRRQLITVESLTLRIVDFNFNSSGENIFRNKKKFVHYVSLRKRITQPLTGKKEKSKPGIPVLGPTERTSASKIFFLESLG